MKVREQTILETVLPIFIKQGIRATTLTEVARANGMPVQELRTHFRSKKGLVFAFVEYLLARHTSYLQINPALSPTAIIELQNFFLFIEKLASEFTPTMLFELKRYDRTSWEKLVEFRKHSLVPYLQKNLKRGINEGNYRHDIDLNLYAALYFNLLYAVITEHNGQVDDSQRMLPEFNNVFLRGMLSTQACRM